MSSSLMMEEIDRMIVQMRLKDSKTVLISKTELTDVQFQKLRKHFETDRYPNEETLQAFAEELKLQKDLIRVRFLFPIRMGDSIYNPRDGMGLSIPMYP